MYSFILDYIKIIKLLVSRGYEIAEAKLNILKYEDEIRRRCDASMPYGSSPDPLAKACKKLYEDLSNSNLERQDAKILVHLGVDDLPFIALHEKFLGETDLVQWTVAFTDEREDKSRYERVYFPPEVSEDEVWTQSELRFRGFYYEEEPFRVLSPVRIKEVAFLYRGYIYTIKV